MGIMENKMETTRVHRDYIGYVLGLYRDCRVSDLGLRGLGLRV